MRKQQLIILIGALLLIGCSSNRKIRYQDQPPKFLGRVLQNTVSRYNSFYNSNFIYTGSLISGEDGYQEEYNELLPVSVQDAVAKSGSMSGEMDKIIQKTATDIDKHPYSKWVDDNYLLNGIAHYVKGDYEMALDIFLYTSSEYKNGIDYTRVGARQKVKRVNVAKSRKQQAEKKLKEREQQLKEQKKDVKNAEKKRKQKAKKYKKRGKTKRLSREEQFKLKQKAKKQGRDVTTEELLKEIRERQKEVDAAGKRITKEDKELIKNVPTKKNDNADNPGFLAHPLAAKDAMLWLAKTYITTEKFIAANAVLTAINEDESFPNRLNMDYYLTYADMHIRLDNLPKAIEYVQLAINDSKRRNKGRLYYILGQLYTKNDQPNLAKEAFATLEKFHPEYDMIYYAKMKNYRADYQNGLFAQKDYTKELKKMSKDVKNEEFFSEVYYYLGNAYLAQGQPENAIKSYEAGLEEQALKPFNHSLIHQKLGTYYYDADQYEKAKEHYDSALESISDKSFDKAETELRASALEKIVDASKTIKRQDSLLNLASLPEKELQKLIEKKAQKELKRQFREKLEKANSNFGSGTNTTNTTNRPRRRRRSSGANAETFYFYDMQQSSAGYSDFKRIWGNRSNTDNWRRASSTNSRVGNISSNQNNGGQSQLSKEDLIRSYYEDIPSSPQAKEKAVEAIQESYLTMGETFIKDLGETDKGEKILKELVDERYPTQVQMKEVQQLLILAYKMKGDSSYINSLNQSREGKKAIQETANNRRDELQKADRLYEDVYSLYAQGDYKNAIEVAKHSEELENNPYKDKFAFIMAISKGQLSDKKVMVEELETFVKNYPNSPLKQKALDLIKQNK